MNALWISAATALLLAFVPAGIAVLRGSTAARLVALQFLAGLTVLLLLLIPAAMNRTDLFDGALAAALLMLPSTLFFAYVYRRWLK